MLDRIIRIISRSLIAFAVFILVLSICAQFMGNESEILEMSLYQLGNQGIAIETIFQGFLLSLAVSCINEIVDLFHSMLVLWKTILRVVLITLTAVLFIIYFDWFPSDLLEAWVGFGLSFMLCFTIACCFMVYKTKKENEEYQRLFEQFKERSRYEDHSNQSSEKIISK